MTRGTRNQIIQYIIDADDRITYVSEGWWVFAEENGAGPDCYPPRLLGRSLWDFIAGEETRHLYQIMMAKVRSEKQPVQVPIRCDSPELRRKITIVLKSVADGHIEFLCRTTRIEMRAPVDLLQHDARRATPPPWPSCDRRPRTGECPAKSGALSTSSWRRPCRVSATNVKASVLRF